MKAALPEGGGILMDDDNSIHNREAERMADCSVKSEIAGAVWKIEVAVGDRVSAYDTILVLESMKMEIPVEAPQAGVVKAILVAEADAVSQGQVLAVLEV